MAREMFREVRRRFLFPETRRNERTNNSEKDVPGGLLFALRFRFGLPVSNSRLANCVAFRVVRFPFSFDFGLAFCTFLRTEAGGGVNAPWREVDEPETGPRNEGWAWK
jgi:hypothetical protein